MMGGLQEAYMDPANKSNQTPPSLRRFAVVTMVSVLSIVVLIAVFAVQNLLNQRRVANDVSAVASVRAINTALYKFRGEHADEYPKSLADVSGKIDAALTCGTPPCLRSGYAFTYTLLPATNMGPHYKVEARPNKFGNTGSQSLYSDESGIVRATRDDRAATANDDPIL